MKLLGNPIIDQFVACFYHAKMPKKLCKVQETKPNDFAIYFKSNVVPSNMGEFSSFTMPSWL